MPNINTFKKYTALLLCSFLNVIFFYIGLLRYNFLYALLFLAGGLIITIPLAVLMLRNPFSSMVEGKGIMCLNIDSTGIISPFIVKVAPPYIKAKLHNNQINDIFDREAVYNLKTPVAIKEKGVIDKDGVLSFNIDKDLFNKARFALFSYPCLIYNEQIQTILTKDFLANQEKVAFAEHAVLFLNRKMEELTSVVRDFGRHVVELTKPQGNFFSTTLGRIVIIVAVIIVIILIGYMIFGKGGGFPIQNAVESAKNAIPSAPVLPVNP